MKVKNTALYLSIKPRFADAIFNGSKTVELRRIRPRLSAGSLVLVYVSSPRCSLDGAFEVAELLEGPPCKLWGLVRSQAGVTRKEFNDYFFDCAVGFGIKIKKSWKLDSPTPLQKLIESKLPPPQSYRYVSKDHPCFSKITVLQEDHYSISRGIRII